jgi:glucuronate isomerase
MEDWEAAELAHELTVGLVRKAYGLEAPAREVEPA